MWPLLGARDGTARQGLSNIKVPSGQLSAFMYVCVIPLEFGKGRPTRDQVHFVFVRCLSLGRPTEGGQQGRPVSLSCGTLYLPVSEFVEC